MSANLGGTNIVKPLLEILSQAPKQGIPRQIFLMTDGEVANTDEVFIPIDSEHSNTLVYQRC